MNESIFNRLMSRIKNLVATGNVTGTETSVLQIKTSTNRTNDRIKRIHNYGFMSRPLVGAKSYLLFIGGVLSRGIAVCVDDERHQIELQEGEVAMLDDKGNLIHFTENGIKIVSCKNLDIEVTKDTNLASQNIKVNGKKITVDGEQIAMTASNISFNGGKGVVTGDCICPFTGSPHADISTTVTAGK